jgi:hypothetical protein
VLKPGEPFGPFRPDGEVTGGGPATRAAVLVETSGKNAARFSVARAAAVEAK